MYIFKRSIYLGLFFILLFAKKYETRCEVIAEKLTYHTLPSTSDIQKIKDVDLPKSIELSINDFEFDDGCLNDDNTVKTALKMFEEFEFAKYLKVSEEVLLTFIMTVKNSYRALPYHNWRHALNVTQMMFSILYKTHWSKMFLPFENIGLLISCLCHDVDHRGTTNKFQEKLETPLAKLYPTSTMEEHHFQECITIINETRLFDMLNSTEYEKIDGLIRRSILATDLANYFKNKNQFQGLIESKTHNWSNQSHRNLTHDMLMTACDLNANVKPFEIQKRVAIKVTEEFYQEGDLLKKAFPDIQIDDMMNREKRDLFPEIQVGFIDNVCRPVYANFAKLSENLAPLLEYLETNKKEWNEESKKKSKIGNTQRN